MPMRSTLKADKKEYGRIWMFIFVYIRYPLVMINAFKDAFDLQTALAWGEFIFVLLLFLLCIQKRKYAYYAIWATLIYDCIEVVILGFHSGCFSVDLGVAIGLAIGFIWIAINGIYFRHRKYIFEDYEAKLGYTK